MVEQLEYKRLVKELTPKLRLALARFIPSSEVDDVIQDSFMKLFIVSQTETIDNPTAFVYKVSRNIAIDRLRKASTFDKVKPKIVDDELTSMNIVTQSEKQMILGAINSLPPICRHVFVLRKVHELSHREISERLNISTKTVENHISKGLKLCQQYGRQCANRLSEFKVG